MSKPTEVIEDYLEEDRPIPGQKYACLSFISPEKVLDDKNSFYLYHFLCETNREYTKTYDEFKEDFKYYCEDNEEKLQERFDEKVDFQTNVRGVKVRGVYDNLKAANIRAKVLQKLDSSFHVYVGQVGFWLPWDPNPNNVEEQEYREPELNRLVKEHAKEQTKKEIFYEEEKRQKQKAAMEDSMKQKKLNEEALEKLKQEESELSSSQPLETVEEEANAEAEPNNVSIETTPVDEQQKMSSENKVEEELKESLDRMDPWMERKMTQEEQASNNDNNETNNENQ
jgi:hypothetical protein